MLAVTVDAVRVAIADYIEAIRARVDVARAAEP